MLLWLTIWKLLIKYTYLSTSKATPRYFFNVFFKFIFEREREHEQGRSRERETRIWSRLQALSCQYRAQCGARTHEPWHDLSWSWTLNWLSHLGATRSVFWIEGPNGHDSDHRCRCSAWDEEYCPLDVLNESGWNNSLNRWKEKEESDDCFFWVAIYSLFASNCLTYISWDTYPFIVYKRSIYMISSVLHLFLCHSFFLH